MGSLAWGLCVIFAINEIPSSLKNKTVQEFITDSGNWDCSKVSHLIPQEAAYKILSVNPP